MSSLMLNPIKSIKSNILTNLRTNCLYSQNALRKWDGNSMLIEKKGDRKALVSLSLVRNESYSNPSGNPGCGAGKGGGAGGTVRESGGGLGQYGAAQEEQFFFNKQREQLKALKKKMLEGEKLTRKKDK